MLVYAIALNQDHHNRRTLRGAQIPVKSNLDEISPAPDNFIYRDFQVATDRAYGNTHCLGYSPDA